MPNETSVLTFDPLYTAAYYDAYGEREVARWQTGPRAQMEFQIFCHHLRSKVSPGQRVLDAGCGPGTFARPLIALGARVTCLDLSDTQLSICREAAPGADEYVSGSITDLSRFESGAFDVTLALGGPVSYCLDRAQDAVSELARVTRSGGTVGLSVMSLFGAMHRFYQWILPMPVSVNQAIIESGDLPRDINDGHECHMFRVDELRDLLRGAGLRDIECHASGWLIPNGEFTLPEQGTEAWTMLLDADLRASAEMPGAGTHIIAWGRVA